MFREKLRRVYRAETSSGSTLFNMDNISIVELSNNKLRLYYDKDLSVVLTNPSDEIARENFDNIEKLMRQ